MEQQDKWHEYWDGFLQNKYGKEEVATDEDLFLQVGKTINKKAVNKEDISSAISNICTTLHLNDTDTLIDLCCGNGLITHELKDVADKIIAVDFTADIIVAAKKYKSASNIIYIHDSAITFLNDFQEKFPGITPTKYVMSDALAYFTQADLENILQGINKISGKFIFLLSGIPGEELKWNYYNTDERKSVYQANVAKGDFTNDGIGKWWHPDEIKKACNNIEMKCSVITQHSGIANYRMDVVISK